jgi:putative transposase
MGPGKRQLWSWDITKLLGPVRWTYYYLYDSALGLIL